MSEEFSNYGEWIIDYIEKLEKKSDELKILNVHSDKMANILEFITYHPRDKDPDRAIVNEIIVALDDYLKDYPKEDEK